MVSKSLFSSGSGDWSTPQDLFDRLNEEFEFDLDVCASHSNHKCDRYYTEEDDGLVAPWAGVCWMNPPYGRGVGKWIKKAYEHDDTVVCLIPARTDTRWWHEYVMLASEIRFIKGRLYFSIGEKTGRAPFPSCVVVFSGYYTNISSMEA